MSFVSNLISSNESSEEVAEVLPKFVSSISKSSPLIFFYHMIDAEETTLTVQVLGANISFKFSHQRAKRFISQSGITKQLENKTTGFIAVATSQAQRIVLAAAESGHGLGQYGDLLDKKKGVLPNNVWTRRVISMGRILGMKMGSPYDRKRMDENRDGIFLGSHVEVKLAVHGICVLLESFKITKDLDKVTMEDLHKLRTVRWQDGTRPLFEVYFSRKHCQRCKSLVRRLSDATGITIRLLWRDRLIKKEYVLRDIQKNTPRRPGQPPAEPAFDPQDFDFGDILPDDSDIEVISDDEEVQNIDQIDLTNIRSTSPAGISEEIDSLIDGLAYRVGQMEDCPEGATSAIVGFARNMSAHNRRKNAVHVSKPLPATPVIEAPIEVLEGNERQRQTVPRVQRTLFGRPRSTGGLTRARSASPCRRREKSVRDRSPRRYRMARPENSSARILERVPSSSVPCGLLQGVEDI
ncbi:uncharacterized protein B0J16DRAFT_361114 [Fusarium flagelliforme]|uniref:Uncharacterized protein n=1 Tax=Fusarium flagelliforme TaxID=2675880 RepID=A0A395MXU6_9HYPO|nr:uncharacterized protein B0J16DRAFT_361114 [Fusarium flagelliforme]KAH7192689.1 hypothetical protein B0J16DRAFT_361114 [Fusarium flagelliforme]RFN52530.1 hypothetical protein FIE12Z_3291 [Fusarium flagelliforme]